MVILRVLLDGARTENSLEPEQANDSVRVPPPPQPSFFTATVILQNRREEIFHYLEEGELRERINELFFYFIQLRQKARVTTTASANYCGLIFTSFTLSTFPVGENLSTHREPTTFGKAFTYSFHIRTVLKSH